MPVEDQGALVKLFKKPVPVKMVRHKYEIESLKAELQKLEEAVKASPVQRRRLWAVWKWKGQPSEQDVLAKKVDLIKSTIEKSEKNVLEAHLCALSVLEMAEVKQAYFVMRRHLTSKLHEKIQDPKLRAIEMESIEMLSNMAWSNKLVELALKRQNDRGDWFSFLSEREASELHPKLVQELYDLYVSEFQLDGAELGK